MTNANGTLLRYKSPSGKVWETNAFGRWGLVGAEREFKGPLTELRGWNRRVREPNRVQYVVADGASGTFKGTGARVSQKILMDMAQDYVFEVTANIIITGAVNNWQFNGASWGSVFAGSAIKTGVKAGYGVLSETALKGFRDGLRNLDSGKDWNRNPYNHDKHWDNEWGGNENPTRWRAGTFDYAVGTVVSALGSFASGAATAAAFGVGKDHVKLTGVDTLQAGGLGMAGNVVGNLCVGAVKTLAHQLSSGRLFHNGGVPDILLTFGEKLFERYLISGLLKPAAGLKPVPPPPP
jgi:hypothetical protein